MRPNRQTYMLTAVCLLDLATTVWLVCNHKVVEGNPLMAGFLAEGILAFILAKLVLTALPIVALEWARPRRPVYVRRAMNLAIVLYLGVYVAGVTHVNSRPDGYASAASAVEMKEWLASRPDTFYVPMPGLRASR